MRAPCSQAVLHAPVVQAAQALLTTPPHSSLQAFNDPPLGHPAPNNQVVSLCLTRDPRIPKVARTCFHAGVPVGKVLRQGDRAEDQGKEGGNGGDLHCGGF